MISYESAEFESVRREIVLDGSDLVRWGLYKKVNPQGEAPVLAWRKANSQVMKFLLKGTWPGTAGSLWLLKVVLTHGQQTHRSFGPGTARSCVFPAFRALARGSRASGENRSARNLDFSLLRFWVKGSANPRWIPDPWKPWDNTLCCVRSYIHVNLFHGNRKLIQVVLGLGESSSLTSQGWETLVH